MNQTPEDLKRFRDELLAPIDIAVRRAFRENPHSDTCAMMTDGPGEPLRCTCWKEELRLAMLHAYGFSDGHP